MFSAPTQLPLLRGAACAAAAEGIPAIAVSGAGTRQEAWTNLETNPTSPSIINAIGNSVLTVKVLGALFAQQPTLPLLLPEQVILNINYPNLNEECTTDDVQFVLTRIYPSQSSTDVHTCDNGGVLPDERKVVNSGCFATISVLNSSSKLDVTAAVQADVLTRLSALEFSCFTGPY